MNKIIARLFNGKPLDINSGLYNYGFRDYSSLTGRFTTSDPIQAGDNWYLYCGADPVNFVDLLGLCKLGGENNGNSAINYVNDGLNQVIQGNYTTKVNALGTVVQLAAALVGADILGDVRDLIYDVEHGETTVESVARTTIDTLAVLPIIGLVKYTDEIGTLAKGVVKKVDDTATKTGTNLIDTLSGLKNGKNSGVKVVGSDDELKLLYDKISEGGKPIEWPNYKGKVTETSDGTQIGLRESSKSGGTTIDIRFTNNKRLKVHIE